MTDLRVVTTEGSDKILEEATVQKFADSLRGPLLRTGDSGYDEARKIFNGMIDRRPALIARCAGAADVIQAAMSDAMGAEPPFGVSLRLTDEKPPALHHGGFIDYGAAGGSYYYSRTRLSVVGAIAQGDGEPVPVSGIAWMDHQWGDFVVAAAGGWDWYSLQLDDGSELMLYVLRSATGETTGVYGSEISHDGTLRDLQPGSVLAEVTGSWTSPHTGAGYPSGWLVTLPDGARLVLRPQLQDQELWFPEVAAAGIGTMAYWEGAVDVSGDRTTRTTCATGCRARHGRRRGCRCRRRRRRTSASRAARGRATSPGSRNAGRDPRAPGACRSHCPTYLRRAARREWRCPEHHAVRRVRA